MKPDGETTVNGQRMIYDIKVGGNPRPKLPPTWTEYCQQSSRSTGLPTVADRITARMRVFDPAYRSVLMHSNCGHAYDDPHLDLRDPVANAAAAFAIWGRAHDPLEHLTRPGLWQRIRDWFADRFEVTRWPEHAPTRPYDWAIEGWR